MAQSAYAEGPNMMQNSFITPGAQNAIAFPLCILQREWRVNTVSCLRQCLLRYFVGPNFFFVLGVTGFKFYQVYKEL